MILKLKSAFGCLIHVDKLLLPSCKPGVLRLCARTMADSAARSDAVPREESAKDETNLVADEETDAVSSETIIIESKPDKFPKKKKAVQENKVALLMAYCGFGYYGMQRNVYKDSIEGEFFKALHKAGLINREHLEVPEMLQFKRASRTDKGVSAAHQVVSLRLRAYDPALSKTMVDRINANLPPDIRVMGIKKTGMKFNANTWCDARTYSYTVPTYAFTPVTEITTEDYRITDDVLDRLNSVLGLFKGDHKFHNFTSKRKACDKKVQRNILEFESGKPFLEDGLELLTITVKGKGFMLSQIRKMIGLTVLVMRDLECVDIIEKAWNKDKLYIPRAPPLGLLLEQADYDDYNKRRAERDSLQLDWSDLKETIEDFKRNKIRLPFLALEKQEKPLFQWLSKLPRFVCEPLISGTVKTRSNIGWAWMTVRKTYEAEDSSEEDAD